jgi:HK97 family phage prohead protease
MTRLPLECKDDSSPFIAAAIEAKFAPDTGAIEGYGAVFGNVDRHGDVVRPGAFAKSLAEHKAADTRPIMLWAHDTRRPIGVWDSLIEDSRGLKVAGQLNLETRDGQEARALLKQGALSGLSIGYRVAPGGAEIDRKTGVRNLRDLELWEVSLVTLPSNGLARVSGVKGIDSLRDFESFLHQSGFPKSAARKLAGGGWSALSNQDQQSASDLAAALKSAILDLKGSST